MNILDINGLIQPIAEGSSTGIDPREDISPTSRYYLLKDIRNVARAHERKAIIEDEGLMSISNEWKPILEQVPAALSSECKDLEFVAWLIEALCRLHGFKGLAVGFTVASKLIDLYWDDLYPTPDPLDLSERLAPLIGLNGIESEGSLVQPIKCILITNGASEGPFSTWEYEQAYEVNRLDPAKQEKRIEAGAVSLDCLNSSIKETSDEFLLQLNDDIQDAVSAFSLLSTSMDKAMAGEPQPTSYISKALQVCESTVSVIARDAIDRANISQVPADNGNANVADDGSAGTHFKLSEQIASREQAIKNLAQISEFFRTTEPHSPMSYAIEQVVRWSNLSLPELLQELIVDGEARTGFFKLSGIKVEE